MQQSTEEKHFGPFCWISQSTKQPQSAVYYPMIWICITFAPLFRTSLTSLVIYSYLSMQWTQKKPIYTNIWLLLTTHTIMSIIQCNTHGGHYRNAKSMLPSQVGTLLCSALRKICKFASSDNLWLQASLPVNSGGLGIHSTSSLAMFAF